MKLFYVLLFVALAATALSKEQDFKKVEPIEDIFKPQPDLKRESSDDDKPFKRIAAHIKTVLAEAFHQQRVFGDDPTRLILIRGEPQGGRPRDRPPPKPVPDDRPHPHHGPPPRRPPHGPDGPHRPHDHHHHHGPDHPDGPPHPGPHGPPDHHHHGNVCMDLAWRAGTDYCSDDIRNFCSSKSDPPVAPDGKSIVDCLEDHKEMLSKRCEEALDMFETSNCEESIPCWEEVHDGVAQCADDTEKFCPNNTGCIWSWHKCIAEHADDLSQNCKDAGAKVHECMKDHGPHWMNESGGWLKKHFGDWKNVPERFRDYWHQAMGEIRKHWDDRWEKDGSRPPPPPPPGREKRWHHHHDDHHQDGSWSSSSSSESDSHESSSSEENQRMFGMPDLRPYDHPILLIVCCCLAGAMVLLLLWKAGRAIYGKCRARRDEPLFSMIPEDQGHPLPSDQEYDQFMAPTEEQVVV